MRQYKAAGGSYDDMSIKQRLEEEYGGRHFPFLSAWIIVVEAYLCIPVAGELDLWSTLTMGQANPVSPSVSALETPQQFAVRISQTQLLFQSRSKDRFNERTTLTAVDIFIRGVPETYREAMRWELNRIDVNTVGLIQQLGHLSIKCNILHSNALRTRAPTAADNPKQEAAAAGEAKPAWQQRKWKRAAAAARRFQSSDPWRWSSRPPGSPNHRNACSSNTRTGKPRRAQPERRCRAAGPRTRATAAGPRIGATAAGAKAATAAEEEAEDRATLEEGELDGLSDHSDSRANSATP
jgi:hypothetical protein